MLLRISAGKISFYRAKYEMVYAFLLAKCRRIFENEITENTEKEIKLKNSIFFLNYYNSQDSIWQKKSLTSVELCKSTEA